MCAVTAFCIFWVRWPNATAAKFVNNPTKSRDSGMIANMNYHSNADAIPNYVRIKGRPELISHPRTWTELLAGRRFFSYGIWYFTVARGTIEVGPANLGYPDPRYYKSNATTIAVVKQ